MNYSGRIGPSSISTRMSCPRPMRLIRGVARISRPPLEACVQERVKEPGMKTIILEKPGEFIRIETEPPTELGPAQAEVAVAAHSEDKRHCRESVKRV